MPETTKDSLLSTEIIPVTNTATSVEFVQWCESIGRGSFVAIDCETTGLVEYNWSRVVGGMPHFLRVVSIAYGKKAWAIPVDKFKYAVMEGLDALKINGAIPVFHNGMFDIPAFRLSGIADFSRDQWPRVNDTMLLHSLWHSNRPHGLDYIPKQLFGVDYKKAMQGALRIGRRKVDWANISDFSDPYLMYAAADAVMTLAIWTELHERMSKLPVWEAYDRELAYMRIMESATWRGLYVDVEDAQAKYYSYRSKADAIRSGLPFNPNSGAQIAAHIPDLPDVFTESGTRVTDKDALKSSTHPYAAAVLEFRKLNKYASTYFKHMSNPSAEGTIHPSVRTMGAQTGRSSIADPPFQQLPKDTYDVREVVVAPPGHKLVSIDYSQQEMRVFAHYAKSNPHITAIMEGVDLHQWVADLVSITRTEAKTFNFALLYGAGVGKIAEQTGVPEYVAQANLDRYFAAFPDVHRFMKEMSDEMKRLSRTGEPYITTSGGRRCYIESDKSYVAVNYLCQGSGADILKEAVVRLDAMGLSEYILLPVHDELLFSFPEKEAEQLAHECKVLMEDHSSFLVPLLCDASAPMDRWRKE